MTFGEFSELQSTSFNAMKGYLVEVERTSMLLQSWTGEALSFRARLALMRQQVKENDALEMFIRTKRRLFTVARFGYELVT